MAKHDRNPDADTVALSRLIHEIRKSNVSIDEFFAEINNADDPAKIAEMHGISMFDDGLIDKLQALVGGIDVNLDMPLSDDSDIS